jgi:hypothetical protein
MFVCPSVRLFVTLEDAGQNDDSMRRNVLALDVSLELASMTIDGKFSMSRDNVPDCGRSGDHSFHFWFSETFAELPVKRNYPVNKGEKA